MIRRFLLVFFIGSLVTAAYAQQITKEAVYGKIKEAFQTKKASALSSLLAPEFSLGVYTNPTAEKMLGNIISRYAVDSISMGTYESKGNKNTLALSLYLPDNKVKTTTAWLNNQNQILYVDLFDELYRLNRYGDAKLVASIPFEVHNGSIIITARINDFERPLKLLFDTGADGMAMSKVLADSVGLIESRSNEASVVGGTQKIIVSEGNTVKFTDFEYKNQSIAIFEKMSDRFDGIIGNIIARDYIVKVDYDKAVIELFNFGNYEYEKEGSSTAINFPSGLPVVPLTMQVGKKIVDGKFIFDTGAGYYLIAFGPFVKKNLLLTNGFVPWFNSSTVSMGHASPTFTGNFSDVTIGDIKFTDFPGTLKAHMAGDENWNPSGDGSLGIKIISRFNFTINLADKIIHFTPNKYYNLPHDFMLAKWYMSFNEKKEILVNNFTGMNPEKELLQQGDIILSVNNTTSEKLCDKPDKLIKLQTLNESKLKFTVLRNGAIIKI